MSCSSEKISFDIDPVLCAPPDGATLEILLGQIFMLFERLRKSTFSAQSCVKCSSMKENFRRYKSLTQRRIDGLELQLSAAKKKLSQSTQLQGQTQPQKRTAVEILAEDSTLFDTPEKKPINNEEVPETQDNSAIAKSNEIPLVLKYDRSPGASEQLEAGKHSPGKKRLGQAKIRLRREPSWVKTEPQAPKTKRGKATNENIFKNNQLEFSEVGTADGENIRTENVQQHRDLQSNTSLKESECVECQRFFKNLDPGLVRVMKRCSKHRYKSKQAVVPSEMWRTKMQDTLELKAAGICDETLPCDLNPNKFKKKGFL